MKAIHLQELLQSWVSKSDFDNLSNPLITHITNDSRNVQTGSLFIAYKGLSFDGREYILESIKKGATAVVYDPQEYSKAAQFAANKIPIIAIPNVNEIQGLIAGKFYGDPSHKMKVIGVTGTSGKTSCTHFIAQLFEMLGIHCGIVGTLGSGLLKDLKTNTECLTTPNAIELQKILYQLHQQGAQVVAMEVASHALEQHRVNGVKFEAAVFTQLSRDHLDYHGTMEAYGAAKKKLFQFPSLKHAVVNADDDLGKEIIELNKNDKNVVAYSLEKNIFPLLPSIIAKNIKSLNYGYAVDVETPWGNGTFNTSLIGRFNISNLLAVLGVVGVMNLPLEKALQLIPSLYPVKGRMQLLHHPQCPRVIVDYSHKPDALQKVLTVLREYCQGKIWCVFGCGGNRDRGKRPQMAAIAEKSSDQIIVTSDNSRKEKPEQIFEDILQGFTKKDRVKIIVDRAEAIKYAIQNAAESDIVLLAGKGHEEYQIIGEEKFYFSDVEEATKQFSFRSKLT